MVGNKERKTEKEEELRYLSELTTPRNEAKPPWSSKCSDVTMLFSRSNAKQIYELVLYLGGAHALYGVQAEPSSCLSKHGHATIA